MVPTATLSAFLDTHIEVSNALRELQLAGIEPSIISVIGKDAHTDGHSVGFYQTGRGPHYKGPMGAFWTGLWSLLPTSAYMVIPGVGQVLMAGPIVHYLVNGREGVDDDHKHHAIHCALIQNHVPSSHVAQYESALRSGQFILLIHGTAAESAIARIILQRGGHHLPQAHVRLGITPPTLVPSLMRRQSVTLTSFALLALCAAALGGCGDSDSTTKGPAQRAGEATDKAVEKTGEAIKEGANKTGQAVEKAGDKIQDATK